MFCEIDPGTVNSCFRKSDTAGEKTEKLISENELVDGYKFCFAEFRSIADNNIFNDKAPEGGKLFHFHCESAVRLLIKGRDGYFLDAFRGHVEFQASEKESCNKNDKQGNT